MTDIKLVEKTSERLKNLIARFVLKYNYWGYLFSRVRRKAVKGLPSIMGVGAEPDGTISLFYEPTMLDLTDDENVAKVIEHEGLHLLNKHIPRLIRILADEVDPLTKNSKMQIWNIASDCCVNQQAGFKDNFVIGGKNVSLCFPEKYNLEPGKITEYYYLELLKNAEKIEIPMGGTGPGDHTSWAKNLSGVSDLSSLSRKVDQHVRRIIKESAKTYNKERGRLPAHIAELIQGALAAPKAPYYQIIRKLVRGTRFSKFMRSPTKINRKRTYTFSLGEDVIPEISPFPGKTRDFTFDIVVLIDTSGSMSNDDVKEGLSGVKNIIEKDRHCYTTVLEVDAGVEKEYTCKKVRDIQFNIKGRGGTTLGPGLFRAKELGCDVCLAFTDGYTEDINNYSRKRLPKKIIWVIVPNGTSKNVNKTGYVVRI
ncbi:MAG: VWA-like domain-containing protein [Candidatus Thorarchaeota archaeon]